MFQLKRVVVRQLAERVTIDRDRNLAVTIRLDVPELIRQTPAPIEAGTYTGIFDVTSGRVLIIV